MMKQYKAEVLRHTDYVSPSWVGVGSVRATYEEAKADLALFFNHNAEWGNWTVSKTRILARRADWDVLTEEDVNDGQKMQGDNL